MSYVTGQYQAGLPMARRRWTCQLNLLELGGWGNLYWCERNRSMSMHSTSRLLTSAGTGPLSERGVSLKLGVLTKADLTARYGN